MTDTNKTPTLEQRTEALEQVIDSILVFDRATGLREQMLRLIVERDEAKESKE